MNTEKTFEMYSYGESHSEGRRSDVIIIGAGVAGSALAYALGKDGREVHVIERNMDEPNTISGQLLHPVGYMKLLELGLEDCVREIDAKTVFGYVIHKDGESTALPFDLEKNGGDDVAARCFNNGRFVQKLRNKASSLPNVKVEQGTATSLIGENGAIKGIKYRTRDGQQLTAYAPLTVISDGNFSRFRKFLSIPKIEKLSSAAEFIIENSHQFPYMNYAHIIFGDPLSIWYPISTTQIRFLVDFPDGQKLNFTTNSDMSHFLKTVVAPQLPIEIYDDFISSIDKVEIRIRPISSMHAAPNLIPGSLLLGDALSMRHVITGGGITVALNDVAILTNLFSQLNLDDKNAVTKQVKEFYKSRKPMAFTISVMAIHKVICRSPQEIKNDIQKACFNCLCLGQGFFAGPVVRPISGRTAHRIPLIFCISAVAIYIICAILFPFPSPKRVYAASQLMMLPKKAVLSRNKDGAAIAFPVLVRFVFKQAPFLKTVLSKKIFKI